jgi:hypothetical protein
MDPLDAVVESVASVCSPSARIAMVMTHPAFRAPRHSGWGYDASRKLAYRRVDAYLSSMSVPMKSVAGSPPTRSHHRPMSAYVNALAAVGFAVEAMTELPDLPSAPGTDDNRDIPLLLGMRAVRRPQRSAGP